MIFFAISTFSFKMFTINIIKLTINVCNVIFSFSLYLHFKSDKLNQCAVYKTEKNIFTNLYLNIN